MRRSLEQAAAAVGGRLVDGRGAELPATEREAAWEGATFDSRTVRGGELFFALPGEKTDGHRFVAAALDAGAAAAVVHHDPTELASRWEHELPADARLLRVGDVDEALHALVRDLRGRALQGEGAPRRIVGLTGSVGKTTTKELLAALLGRRYRVARNEGNLNNLYGFPLSLLRLPDDVEWMVAELGMSTAGELATLTRLARPDAVVYTCVRPAHLENFADLRGIAEAKAELLEAVEPDGFCIANAADPEVVRFVRRWQQRRRGDGASDRVVWYAAGEVAATAGEAADGAAGEATNEVGSVAAPEPQVTALDVRPAGGGQPGSRFTLEVRGLPEAGEGPLRRELHLALHGAYNVANALAATACALVLGVSLDDVAVALAAARPASGRGIVHRRPDGSAVVDDTYNSNPEALARALEAATDLAAGGRRWAVLGDMLELGPEGARFHREAGVRAAELGFAPVVGVGELAKELAAAAEEAGAESRWYADAATAADALRGELAAGDTVLVKGSRGVGLDVVVERLLAAAEAPAAPTPADRADRKPEEEA